MRRELLWAALWLWAGLCLGLFVRPATGQAARAAAPADGAGSDALAPSAGATAPGLSRLAGTWYDIAATPDRFHEGCRRAAASRYTPRPDAALQVRQQCLDAVGVRREVAGVLRRQPDGRLQLRYAPDWMAWLPLAWSEVRLIGVDPDLHRVVLATPDLAHLWVMAREPLMPPEDYEALLARLRAMGAGTEALRRFPQGAGAEG